MARVSSASKPPTPIEAHRVLGKPPRTACQVSFSAPLLVSRIAWPSPCPVRLLPRDLPEKGVDGTLMGPLRESEPENPKIRTRWNDGWKSEGNFSWEKYYVRRVLEKGFMEKEPESYLPRLEHIRSLEGSFGFFLGYRLQRGNVSSGTDPVNGF